jgi:hypothetical protein
MHKRPLSLARLRHVPSQFSWVDQRLVRDRYIDQLSSQACASSELHQARQALITRGLIAYQRPLYQVLALDAAPHETTVHASTVVADDDPVDIKAVLARIWEVLS